MGFISMGGSLSSMMPAAAAINPALALGFGAGLADTANNYYWSKKNYDLQFSQYDYQRLIQQLLFSREDNSIQRRVADLKAAGLSPVLAAGQGAGSGGTVAVNAPQMDFKSDLSASALMALNLMKMESEISATRAQEEYTRMQQRNAEELLPSQIESLKANASNAKSQAYKTYQDAKISKVAGNNAEDTGFVPKTTIGGWLYDTFNAGTAAAEKTKQIQKATGKPIKPDLTPKKDSNFTPFWTPEGREKINKLRGEK